MKSEPVLAVLPSSADTPCWCAGSQSGPEAWTEPPDTEDSRHRTWTRTRPAADGTPPEKTQTLSRCSAAAGDTEQRGGKSVSTTKLKSTRSITEPQTVLKLSYLILHGDGHFLLQSVPGHISDPLWASAVDLKHTTEQLGSSYMRNEEPQELAHLAAAYTASEARPHFDIKSALLTVEHQLQWLAFPLRGLTTDTSFLPGEL